MKKCPWCSQEYPDDATACLNDQQPLTSCTPSLATTPEAVLSKKLSPQAVVWALLVNPRQFIRVARKFLNFGFSAKHGASQSKEPQRTDRSRLGRLLGSRVTWFFVLALAWALVLLRVVPPPSTSFYGKPPVDHYELFAILFPIIAPLGIFPFGPSDSLWPLILWVLIFWSGFIWFMFRLKVLRSSTLCVMSMVYLMLIALLLFGWAEGNRTPAIFDL